MCINPTRIKDPSTKGKFIDVPCGKCKECKRAMSNKWVVRLCSEASVADACYFSLLSYDDLHLPDPMVPDKRAIQLFVKRLRASLADVKFMNHIIPELISEYNQSQFASENNSFVDKTLSIRSPVKLKYFIVSEYGEEKNRLHYHCIWFLYGVTPLHFPWQLWKCFLEYHWKMGFCSAFPVTQRDIRYCTKYMHKQYNVALYSRLGYDAFVKFRGDTFNCDFAEFKVPQFPIGGKLYSLPRSWLQKLKFLDPVSGKVFYDYLYRRGDYLRNNPPQDTRPYSRRVKEQEKFYLDNLELFKPKEIYNPQKFKDL